MVMVGLWLKNFFLVMLKDVEYEWTCMVPVCGKENPPAPNGMVRPATPPATLPDGGPPPVAQHPVT